MAAPYTKLAPRGKNPYPIGPAVAAPFLAPRNATPAQWKQFFSTVGGETLSRLIVGSGDYATLAEAVDHMMTGMSLWAGFDTYPLPIPYQDMYVPVGFFDTPVPGGGAPGGGGGPTGGPARVKQLQGLGAATQVFPVRYPPHGYTGKGQNLGNGWMVLYGNTNGNPAPGIPYWIAYAVVSNGKYRASPVWAQSAALKSWDASFVPQQRLATQVTNLVATAAGAVAIGYAAAAALGTTATGTGTAAGGTAAGGTALAPTEIGTVTSTSTLAAPVTATGISVPAATLTPLASAVAPATGAVVAGSSGSLLSTAAGAITTGAKLAVATTGLVAAVSGTKKPVGVATSAATGQPAAPAAGGSILAKLAVPGAILAALALMFT